MKDNDNYKEKLNMLSFKERTIFRIALFINQYMFFMKRVIIGMLGFIVYPIYKKHTISYNTERLAQYNKGSKLILASNHRSLYDNFIIISQIFLHRRAVTRRVLCPVRSNFWYESYIGLFLNIFGSGMTMFPPMFRQSSKKPFNRISIDTVVEAFSTKKGQILGIHPEGTRNKNHDLYSLLKGKSGIGEIALRSTQVTVIPIFIHNTSCSVLTEIKRNYSKKHAANISINFGHPVYLEDLRNAPLTKNTIMEATNRCMQEIKKLSEEMKQILDTTDKN